ncbi:MAG: hypothetical protein SFZ23_14140 [Planctomycetota bacterium]|nr:hypothetical protein [Planctomycetota bacterium]
MLALGPASWCVVRFAIVAIAVALCAHGAIKVQASPAASLRISGIAPPSDARAVFAPTGTMIALGTPKRTEWRVNYHDFKSSAFLSVSEYSPAKVRERGFAPFVDRLVRPLTVPPMPRVISTRSPRTDRARGPPSRGVTPDFASRPVHDPPSSRFAPVSTL